MPSAASSAPPRHMPDWCSSVTSHASWPSLIGTLEYVQDWAKLHDQPPQFPSPGPNITVTRMNWASKSADTMTMDDVTCVLLDNQIPVPWIDHAYTFGLHYLNHHLGHMMAAQSTLEAVDDMRIVNLSVWGIPPAISEWDGWHTVVEHDMLCLYQVLENEEHRDIYCTDDSPAWLCVGEDPHFEQVRTRRQETDPRIHHSPPPPSSNTHGVPRFFVNFFLSYLYMGFRHKHHIIMIIMLYIARL
jgi:hypothetical protein